ncbi:hypothetical protein TWF718_006328 [Orbilia javanica]|uniref:Clr5 domain-containing protein n=1 Tax=Orbilia javanica TaxID=47235 RepID=A0AAN8N9E4_9PEZI
MWVPPPSTSNNPLEVNQYVGDKSSKKRAYVKIEEWEPHKDFVLRQRHAKVKEKDILHALRHERGFMVEMHQLKKVLQLWNSKRNLKRKQRDYIVQIVKERRRAGKNQTIFYHPSGTLIDLPEVKEIMRRYGNSEPLEPPSPGGLIPGSPRLRQTPPEILFNHREISPNHSDRLSLAHSSASPGSLGSLHSPIGEAGLEYTTPPHLAIDLFLQQTTAQSSANVTVPTTIGLSSDIPGGPLYSPVGYGDELLMSSTYSNVNRPMRAPELDPLADYRLQGPILQSMPSASSIPTGYFPAPSDTSPNFFLEAAPPPPPMQSQPTSEQYSYLPPPVSAAPPRPLVPGHYAPPGPPQMRPAPLPPSAPPQAKSRSILSRFGFTSSKKSSQPPLVSGGSMVQPGPPQSAPYMQPSASADQIFTEPTVVHAAPPPQMAAPGISAPAPRFRTPSRSAARQTPQQEPLIKQEFAEISTLDYSRDEFKKSKDSKSFGYSEMADRAGRLLSGMPPKEAESSRRARQRAEEEEVMRRRVEEARLESERLEKRRFFAQEQERLRALEQERIREEAMQREFERAYIQPEPMDEDDDDDDWWSETEQEQNLASTRGPVMDWKKEEEEDQWPEEDGDYWPDTEVSHNTTDLERQRLQATLERVAGKFKFHQPIMRFQREIKIQSKHTIFARVESKKLVFDVHDDFKIKLKEIKNDDSDDVTSALEGLSIASKGKKRDDEDLADALGALKVSDDKKEKVEKWDDPEEEEEWSEEEKETKEDNWGDENEKEDEWGEEDTEDKWGDGEDDKVLAKLNNLTVSEKSPATTEQHAFPRDTPESADAMANELETNPRKYIPFKKLLTVEFGYGEFHKVEFASNDMEQIYRIHVRDWLEQKVKDAEWELGMAPSVPQKSDGKKFLGESRKRPLPNHIYKATKHLVKADIDPDASEAEIQYETKLWNWVLQRHKTMISYMKENADTYWTAMWNKTEQAIVYFLPFLGRRFGSKHWFTLEGIKLLGQSYIWEEIEGGWKYGLQLRNMAYDGFVSLGFGNAGIVSDCIDDGVTEMVERKGRRKMELRRAVEHYRTIREDFGDWSQLGVYAIGLLVRALARVDRVRAKKLAPIAAAGLLEIPKSMVWTPEVSNSIFLVSEALREVGMVKESVALLWKTIPSMREIKDNTEAVPATRVLGGIAEGFQELGKPVQAMQLRTAVLGVLFEALGRDHPETVFWTKRARRGLESRGIQFIKDPSLKATEWVAGKVFWEGKRRGLNQRRLLKLTRKTIRRVEPDYR